MLTEDCSNYLQQYYFRVTSVWKLICSGYLTYQVWRHPLKIGRGRGSDQWLLLLECKMLHSLYWMQTGVASNLVPHNGGASPLPLSSCFWLLHPALLPLSFGADCNSRHIPLTWWSLMCSSNFQTRSLDDSTYHLHWWLSKIFMIIYFWPSTTSHFSVGRLHSCLHAQDLQSMRHVTQHLEYLSTVNMPLWWCVQVSVGTPNVAYTNCFFNPFHTLPTWLPKYESNWVSRSNPNYMVIQLAGVIHIPTAYENKLCILWDQGSASAPHAAHKHKAGYIGLLLLIHNVLHSPSRTGV